MSGFGYLIPSKEKEDYLGVLFTSSIFKNRAPENHTLITVFVGGARNPKMASLSESDMISKLYPKIQSCLQIKGDPVFSYTRHWESSIPQYSMDHDKIISQIQNFENKIQISSYPAITEMASLGDCFSDFPLPI